MTRKIWTIAVASLFIVCIATMVNAQSNGNGNGNGNQGENPGNGNQGENPGNGNQGDNPGNGNHGGNPGNGNQGDNPGNGNQGDNPGNGNQGDNPGNGNQGDNPGNSVHRVTRSGNSARRTPDGSTPAEEAICDDLKHRTPGLYGLCIAFCEAHDCVITVTDDGELDFSQCKKNDGKILAKYRSKMRDGDPDMPCLPATQANEQPENSCPCWSLEQLSNFPYGLYAPTFADSSVECASFEEWDYAENCNFGINYVSETIWLSDGMAYVDFGAFGGEDCGANFCFGAFNCNAADPADCEGWIPVYDEAVDDIGYDQYLNCQAQLQQLQEEILCGQN
jgi:hypothetical protein